MPYVASDLTFRVNTDYQRLSEHKHSIQYSVSAYLGSELVGSLDMAVFTPISFLLSWTVEDIRARIVDYEGSSHDLFAPSNDYTVVLDYLVDESLHNHRIGEHLLIKAGELFIRDLRPIRRWSFDNVYTNPISEYLVLKLSIKGSLPYEMLKQFYTFYDDCPFYLSDGDARDKFSRDLVLALKNKIPSAYRHLFAINYEEQYDKYLSKGLA